VANSNSGFFAKVPKTESGLALLNSVIDAPYHALDAIGAGMRFAIEKLLPSQQAQGKTVVLLN
jgi:hypothetical protein